MPSVHSRSLGASLFVTFWLLSVSISKGAVMVHGTATPIPGAFHYELVVSNTGPEDIVLVSLVDAPLDDPLIDPTLTTPPDFLGLYDSGLGIVDFLEDTDFFGAGTETSGFSFHSLAGPDAFFTSFEAFSTEADFISGDVEIRLLPGDPGSAVPDTGAAWVLFGLGLTGLISFRKRLRVPRRM